MAETTAPKADDGATGSTTTPAPTPPAAPRPTAPLAPRADGDDGKPLTLTGLAAYSPTVQKNMIGERLYRLIHTALRERTGKVTGMLLDLDNADLLVLLESPEALNAKVNEALAVLREAAALRSAPEPAHDGPRPNAQRRASN